VFEYLQQHPGTPQERLPRVLLWRVSDNLIDSNPSHLAPGQIGAEIDLLEASGPSHR
jgi:hypothetical protein